MQSISLNNDVTFYILPIASIIHNHLGMVNAIQPDKLPSEWCALINAYLMKENITEPSIVSEVPTFAECGLCGTAAVISPVGRIHKHEDDTDILFPSGMDAPGPVTAKLYETLTGIQYGTVEAPEGWIHVIK